MAEKHLLNAYLRRVQKTCLGEDDKSQSLFMAFCAGAMEMDRITDEAAHTDAGDGRHLAQVQDECILEYEEQKAKIFGMVFKSSGRAN